MTKEKQNKSEKQKQKQPEKQQQQEEKQDQQPSDKKASQSSSRVRKIFQQVKQAINNDGMVKDSENQARFRSSVRPGENGRGGTLPIGYEAPLPSELKGKKRQNKERP